jgi:hypothetical protein
MGNALGCPGVPHAPPRLQTFATAFRAASATVTAGGAHRGVRDAGEQLRAGLPIDLQRQQRLARTKRHCGCGRSRRRGYLAGGNKAVEEAQPSYRGLDLLNQVASHGVRPGGREAFILKGT